LIPRETARKRTERLGLRNVSNFIIVHVLGYSNSPIQSVSYFYYHYRTCCIERCYPSQNGIPIRNRPMTRNVQVSSKISLRLNDNFTVLWIRVVAHSTPHWQLKLHFISCTTSHLPHRLDFPSWSIKNFKNMSLFWRTLYNVLLCR